MKVQRYLNPFFVSICLATLLSSCKEKDQTVPYTKVNFTVSIYTNNLIHVGGTEYFTGGISGIVVYRLDFNTFYAYDRACPYDWEYGGYVEVDSLNPLLLVDYQCGSKFNILNGYPYSDSKAEKPLRSYQTRMLDDTRLQVYN